MATSSFRDLRVWQDAMKLASAQEHGLLSKT